MSEVKNKTLIVKLIAAIASLIIASPSESSPTITETVGSLKTQRYLKPYLNGLVASCSPLTLATQAAVSGEKSTLAKLYRLSLLVGLGAVDDSMRLSLQRALISAQGEAKELYLNGNLSDAIERLRLIFNLAAYLTIQTEPTANNETANWISSLKILTLPKDICLSALHDYAFYLNLSGQHKLAINALNAIIQESPNRLVAYWHLADAQIAAGEPVAAERTMQQHQNLIREAKSSKPSSGFAPQLPFYESLLSPPYSTPNETAFSSRTVRLNDTLPFVQIAAKDNSINISNFNQLPWVNEHGCPQDKQCSITDERAILWRKRARHASPSEQIDQNKCLFLNSEAILALQDEQPALAITTLEQALSLDPGNALTLANLSVAYNNLAWQNSADCPKALSTLHQAQACAPSSAVIRANTAAVIRRMGKDPASFQARLALCSQCIDHRDFLGALIECREALRIHSEPCIAELLSAITQRLAYEEFSPMLGHTTSISFQSNSP